MPEMQQVWIIDVELPAASVILLDKPKVLSLVFTMEKFVCSLCGFLQPRGKNKAGIDNVI